MIEGFMALGSWEQAGIVVIGAVLIAQVLDLVIAHTAKLFHKRSRSEIVAIILDGIRSSVYLSIVLIGVSAGLYIVDSIVSSYLQSMVFSVFLIIWSITAIRIGRHIFEFTEQGDSFDHEFIPVFENLWTFTVIVVGILGFLRIWGIDITPLLASAGIAGIAIGFAAKDTVANFFGGIALYFDNTYKEGDYVTLESGTAGTVRDVGVRSTMLETRDGTITTVPNSVLNAAKIENHSAPNPPKRIRVPVGVAYGSDITTVSQILEKVAEESDYVTDERPIKAMFREFGDSSLNFELFCWVHHPLKDVKAQNELNREIYERFADAGIEIPFPQRDVTLSHEDSENT